MCCAIQSTSRGYDYLLITSRDPVSIAVRWRVKLHVLGQSARAFTGHTVWCLEKAKGRQREREKNIKKTRELGETHLFVSRNSICCVGTFIHVLLLSDDIKLTLSAANGKRENNDEESVKQGHFKAAGGVNAGRRRMEGLSLSGAKSA